MKKFMSLLLTGSLLMATMVGCSSNSDTGTASGKTDTLIMGTNAQFPPFEYYEGNRITGFDVELAALIAGELGMNLRIEDMEFNTLVGAVQNGMIDVVVAGMTATDDRKTQIDFTDGYFYSKQMVIVPTNSDITDIDDLEGKRIGVQLGTTGDIFASEFIEDASIIKFDKGAMAVADLKNGTVDAVIIDEQPATSFVSGQNDIKLLEVPFAEEEYAIGLKKGNTELLNDINNALAKLKSNGAYDTLYTKYFSDAD
ncbi:MAG: hypothetical protein ATN36_00785 [Epulopiscium sp. Nele67-Bin005]|nr:MAG: hypothetical protein ATN36_00785 [Epulopiscium sp. Nele67-Bin005]